MNNTPKKSSHSIKDYVLELRADRFFEKPKNLGEIKDGLGTLGHVVPTTTLSSVMIRIVKDQELRRIKDGKIWKYVNR